MNKISANVVAPAGPCCLVIFGASGDLTHRLLVPALYNLAAGGLLPDAFAIIGIARREMSNDAFRSDLAQALRRFAIRGIDERATGRLLARATYVNGDADDPSTYERLDRELAQVERACATGGNRLFYLATPPSAFAPISRHLGRSSIAREEGRRVAPTHCRKTVRHRSCLGAGAKQGKTICEVGPVRCGQDEPDGRPDTAQAEQL
jgi:glucose-6-phosphate 1-dehydrogenase